MENTTKGVRKPAVAGAFYPAQAIELTKTIATMFSEVDKISVSGRPLGLISPHAGYPYSGRTAARAYKLLEGQEYDTVVIVAPSHTVFFQGSSVFDGAGYQTPLGLVEVDQELADKIASIHPSIYYSRMGHATGSTRGEWSLEVQLPFLQVVLSNFKIVPIVMGEQDEDSARALGETLASVLRDTNSLLIASSDLSHNHSQKEARRLDHAVQEAIEEYEPMNLINTLAEGRGEACGGGPMAAVMLATKRLGASDIKLVNYTTSGETTGDFDDVVGYLSAVMTTPHDSLAARRAEANRNRGALSAASGRLQQLSNQNRQALLGIARAAIAAHLAETPYEPPALDNFDARLGLFVTLKMGGQLRGCIGQTRATASLNQAVADMAVAAAFDDPRFPSLSLDELDLLAFEISVLSPLKRVHDLERIEIGLHGLMIKLDLHSGLFLPQVALEHKWNRKQFLEQTCLKAGLPKESYKERLAEIYSFTAEVF